MQKHFTLETIFLQIFPFFFFLLYRKKGRQVIKKETAEENITYSAIAQANPKPSYVDVPRPSSSTITNEWHVADCKIQNLRQKNYYPFSFQNFQKTGSRKIFKTRFMNYLVISIKIGRKKINFENWCTIIHFCHKRGNSFTLVIAAAYSKCEENENIY